MTDITYKQVQTTYNTHYVNQLKQVYHSNKEVNTCILLVSTLRGNSKSSASKGRNK